MAVYWRVRIPCSLGDQLPGGTLDQAQIGSFLGEPYSISQTLRLELINSQRLLHHTNRLSKT
eukprot:3745765-Amphidinium_carterae.1